MFASASGEFQQRHLIREFGLQAGGELEDSALALELPCPQRFVARRVGNIFAEDDDAVVPPHLVLQAQVDQLSHGALGRVRGLRLLGKVALVGGLQILGVLVAQNRSMRCLGQHRLHCAVRGALHLFIHLLLQAVDALRVEKSFAQQPHLLHLRNRVARVLDLHLCVAAIVALIVGERVRVRPDYVSMHQRRSLSRTRIRHCLDHRRVARQRIRPIDLGEVKVWEVRNQPRNVSAGSIHFHRG